MASKLNKIWRIYATGLAFALFGLGALTLSLTLFPLIYLAPKNRAWKQLHTRNSISHTMSLYIFVLRTLGLLTYEVHGLNHIKQGGQLIIANHPSLLDVVFLIAIVGSTNCAVKSSLWRNPFTRGVVNAAGYIANSDESFADKSAASLLAGDSLIIFPQGTRTPAGHKIKFLRGAANAALISESDPLPVYIECLPPTLEKSYPWYAVPDHKPHFTIRFEPALTIQSILDSGENRSRKVRKINALMENFYQSYPTRKSTASALQPFPTQTRAS